MCIYILITIFSYCQFAILPNWFPVSHMEGNHCTYLYHDGSSLKTYTSFLYVIDTNSHTTFTMAASKEASGRSHESIIPAVMYDMLSIT